MISPCRADDATLIAESMWMIAPLLCYVGWWAGGAWFTRKPMDELTFNSFMFVTVIWFWWGWM